MMVPDDIPGGTGEEFDELEEEAELESGPWNAGTERAVRSVSGVFCGMLGLGVVGRRWLEIPANMVIPGLQ